MLLAVVCLRSKAMEGNTGQTSLAVTLYEANTSESPNSKHS